VYSDSVNDAGVNNILKRMRNILNVHFAPEECLGTNFC